MNVYLFDDDRIIAFALPVKKIGNFWMKDTYNKNVINITVSDNEWIINPGKNVKISDTDGNTENISLRARKYYNVEKNDKKYLLYCDYLTDNTYKNYIIKDNSVIKFGSSAACNISVPISIVGNEHITLTYKDKKWTLEVGDNLVCYVNDRRVEKTTTCNYCDLINIYGFKILVVCGYIFVNNPFNNLTINGLEQIDLVVDDTLTDEEIENEDIYKDEDYFLKSPRIRKEINTYEMVIDSPPAKEKDPETPLWVTLAPMLTMAASSMMTLSNSIMAVVDGQKTFKSIIPSLVICISMLLTMLVWPFVTKKFEKKQKQKKEEERQVLYQNYINKKDKELAVEYENQKRTLEENLISTDVCYDMIMNKRRTLWSRRNDQNDFLTVRVGTGDVNFNTKISYHSEDFSMDNDNLKLMLNKLIDFNKVINNVPIGYSFIQNTLTGINGIYPKYISFTNNMLLQAMAFHSYDDLKIVVFTNDANKHRWEYLREMPYCFSNDKSIRFFATNTEEMQEVSNYLVQVFESRKVLSKNGSEEERINNFSKFNNGYYLVIVDDIDASRKIEIISDILESKNNNLGFSMIILEEKLSKVPSEVSKFIIIGEKTSTILNTENNNQTKFIEEINDSYDMFACTKILSNLPINLEETSKKLPDSVTFLELFGVGNIEQLNVLNRWKDNNPTRSLKTEIGVNTVGDPFVLDLHEKQHGPHGLIAGMTGSGKSEFIISYVLSMAVNYSPEEVAFVLIDYKGGGLAGAFVNSETGKKLPHVVGTITNLDKTEINRALASINSELTRRQQVFNDVRLKTGEGTIDIYKYQRLYRDGVIKEPMPHLIIVCDEFAELKDQQPDFMEDLVSTARIGRSLGVHLILATQKPSGVVDGQIWSNSKFKVCLKVQDKQDSMEMIRNDLAAEIKQVGRFYLLVGYSEYFAIGQAAWAGAQYYPNNEFKKSVDKNLYLIDNTGSVSKTINNIISKRLLHSEGEELTNIVKYLIHIGEETPLKINQLWLDRVPNEVYVESLSKKYNYVKEDYVINPIIGEYDNPSSQQQGLLTINLKNNGNTLIYGMNDSGKDELLQTLTYSMLKNYSTDELNLYILDFGAETLNNFRNAPQVGDVVINGDDEKINNLAKLLSFELNKRKKLFTSFGGNYENYIKNSPKKLPNIVVEINSIEILNELYNDIIDKFYPIIRDGNKYGIYFIITTETQSSVKMKVVQSCKNSICLQLTNEMSYKDILGKTNGLVPSNNLGRGLTKLEKVCEFQTAFIDENKNSYDSINKFVKELESKNYTKAPAIHVMPETIELDKFKDKYTGLDTVPIGVVKESLNASLFDFKKRVASIICSSEFENMNLFIKNITRTLNSNTAFKTFMIDAQNYFEEYTYSKQYCNSDFNGAVDIISSFNKGIQDVLTNNNMNFRSVEKYSNLAVVVIGFSKFYDKLDDDHKKAFKEILANNKEYPKVNFILIDIPSGFKKYEYEDWYKNNFDTNNGIWIGQGLSQQFVLKTIVQQAMLSNINNQYAIVIKNGVPILIKILNEIK